MDTEAIRARLAAATPGAWYKQENDLIGGWCVMLTDAPPSMGGQNLADVTSEADADLIAHAPADLAALLAAYEQQAKELEAARAVAASCEAEFERAKVAAQSGSEVGEALAFYLHRILAARPSAHEEAGGAGEDL